MDGDGRADFVVWRSSTSTWMIHNRTTEEVTYKPFGVSSAGDVPVVLDVDGDGLGDLVGWRQPLGEWYWTTSGTGFTDLTRRSLGEPTYVLPDNGERESGTAWQPGCGTRPTCP